MFASFLSLLRVRARVSAVHRALLFVILVQLEARMVCIVAKCARLAGLSVFSLAEEESTDV